MVAPITMDDLFDQAYREARATFEQNVDISVTRDSDELSDRRYVARVVGYGVAHALLLARSETPEEALEALLDKIALWQRLAAAADMPVTLLMGRSPAGGAVR